MDGNVNSGTPDVPPAATPPAESTSDRKFGLLLIHPVLQMYNTMCFLFAVLIVIVWCITAMQWCVTEYLHEWVTLCDNKPWQVLISCYIFLLEIKYLRYTCELFCATALDVFWDSLGTLPLSKFFLNLNAFGRAVSRSFAWLVNSHCERSCQMHRPTVKLQYVFYFCVDIFPISAGIYSWTIYAAIDYSVGFAIICVAIYMIIVQVNFFYKVFRHQDQEDEDVQPVANIGSAVGSNSAHLVLRRAASLMRQRAPVNQVGQHSTDNRAMLLRKVDIHLGPEGEQELEETREPGTQALRASPSLHDMNQILSLVEYASPWCPCWHPTWRCFFVFAALFVAIAFVLCFLHFWACSRVFIFVTLYLYWEYRKQRAEQRSIDEQRTIEQPERPESQATEPHERPSRNKRIVLQMFRSSWTTIFRSFLCTTFVNVFMLATVISLFRGYNWYIALFAFLLFPIGRFVIVLKSAFIQKWLTGDDDTAGRRARAALGKIREALGKICEDGIRTTCGTIQQELRGIPPEHIAGLRGLNYLFDFGLALFSWWFVGYGGYRIPVFTVFALADKSHIQAKVASTIKSGFVILLLFFISIAFIATKSSNPGKEEITTCWSPKAGADCTWIKPSKQMGYPFCGSHLWNTNLSILDFALFSHLAYKSVNTVTDTLPFWLPEWNLHCQRNAWHLNRHRQCNFSASDGKIDWTSFMEFRHRDENISIIAVRGTASPLEALLDLNIWLPAAVLQGGWTHLLASENLNWIHWFVRHKQIYKVSPLKNFEVLSTFVREAVASGRRVILTGHSLGGGLAQLIAKQFDDPLVVTFASPNSLDTNLILGSNRESSLRGRAVELVPQYDLVSGVDTKEGTVFPIKCRPSSTGIGPIVCHMIWETICELLYQCGEVGRNVSIRFHPTNPLDKCDMYERTTID